MIKAVGLDESIYKKLPKELSGGMKQRCAIAQAFSIDPPILLMDEPFGALDAVTRARLQDLVRELWTRDEKKKTVFFVAMGVGVFGCILLGFLSSWIWFLGIFVLAKTGYSASLIFYDAMLTDVTDPERMDAVSSHGYAWGYIGSCIPFILSLVLVLMYEKIGITMHMAMTGVSRRCARSKTVGDRNADCDDHCVYYYCALVAVIVCTASSLLQTEIFCRSKRTCCKRQF